MTASISPPFLVAQTRFARAFSSDVRVLRGLTWQRVGWTFLVAAAFALYSASGWFVRNAAGPNGGPPFIELYANWLQPYLLFFFAKCSH